MFACPAPPLELFTKTVQFKEAHAFVLVVCVPLMPFNVLIKLETVVPAEAVNVIDISSALFAK